MSEEIPFIAQVRQGGGKGGSILITIPKEVVRLMKMKDKDYVKCTVKKIQPEEL